MFQSYQAFCGVFYGFFYDRFWNFPEVAEIYFHSWLSAGFPAHTPSRLAFPVWLLIGKRTFLTTVACWLMILIEEWPAVISDHAFRKCATAIVIALQVLWQTTEVWKDCCLIFLTWKMIVDGATHTTFLFHLFPNSKLTLPSYNVLFYNRKQNNLHHQPKIYCLLCILQEVFTFPNITSHFTSNSIFFLFCFRITT